MFGFFFSDYILFVLFFKCVYGFTELFVLIFYLCFVFKYCINIDKLMNHDSNSNQRTKPNEIGRKWFENAISCIWSRTSRQRKTVLFKSPRLFREFVFFPNPHPMPKLKDIDLLRTRMEIKPFTSRTA